MARRQSIGIRQLLNRLVPRRRLATLADELGVVERRRKVGIVAFFWTLVLGFAAGNERTLAGLRRAFEKATGVTLVPSAFYDRFTPKLVRFLKAILGEAIAKVAKTRDTLGGVLTQFQDVLLADSTVIRLHDLLAGAFPACRTNHTLAALKAHVILSVGGQGPHSVKVTSERVHDGPVLRAGRWVRDRLLLFDLGYYRFQLFDCIRRQGGYFVTRLKDKANPEIVGVHRRWRGQSVPLVGERLQDVLGRLARQVLDVEVTLRFRRRQYAGTQRSAEGCFRLVGIRNAETGKYHLYVTNVPSDRLSAEEVARVYTARWLIELAFRQLKSHYRIDQMPSGKRHVVEALLYAALITMMASHALRQAVRSRLSAEQADRVRDDRWAKVFSEMADQILALVAATAVHPQAHPHLERTLMKEAVDPNRRRILLKRRAELPEQWR